MYATPHKEEDQQHHEGRQQLEQQALYGGRNRPFSVVHAVRATDRRVHVFEGMGNYQEGIWKVHVYATQDTDLLEVHQSNLEGGAAAVQ